MLQWSCAYTRRTVTSKIPLAIAHTDDAQDQQPQEHNQRYVVARAASPGPASRSPAPWGVCLEVTVSFIVFLDQIKKGQPSCDTCASPALEKQGSICEAVHKTHNKRRTAQKRPQRRSRRLLQPGRSHTSARRPRVGATSRHRDINRAGMSTSSASSRVSPCRMRATKTHQKHKSSPEFQIPAHSPSDHPS